MLKFPLFVLLVAFIVASFLVFIGAATAILNACGLGLDSNVVFVVSAALFVATSHIVTVG